MYLNWNPAIHIFEIERPLVFAECESIVSMKTL